MTAFTLTFEDRLNGNPRTPFCALEEYLTLERDADYRSEFRAGIIVSTPGGTELHSRLCTYRDAMAICDKTQFWRRQKDVITNPSVVVEVLSPSTRKYFQTTKSGYYRSLPSLVHLVLVSLDDVAIEWSTRNGNTWTMTEYRNRSDVTPLGFLVEEIHKGILPET